METSIVNQAEKVKQVISSQEIITTLRQYTPQHPALNRMRAKIMQNSGVQAISAYDRMHHRHSRS
jgi:hypothetical protein